MSADVWKPGILALCINDWWTGRVPIPADPHKGQILTVTSMVADDRGLFLWFGPGDGYLASHFVPLPPLTEDGERVREKEFEHA